MLIISKILVRNVSNCLYFNLKHSFCKNSPIKSKMSEGKILVKRYDGRSKKRKWEERRSDKGENVVNISKMGKVEVSNSEIHVPVAQIIDKIKRRKFVLLMGYSGVGYLGMQRNPGKKTIEEELFQALHKSDLINSTDFGQVQNVSFQRAARTDKGVSAARQIVSLKLPENLDIRKINAYLPDEIRVFSYRRVTKGFNSKSQCDSRTYTYMLPTVAFANQNETVEQKNYRVPAEVLQKVRETLQNFVGTKNFHNYTSKKKPTDPSACRYMKSFVCEEPFIRRDTEFAVLKVQGQSFMLHQIRKMVGALLAVVRGLAPNEIIPQSFNLDKVCIPRAPGLGLVLDFVHYDRYNQRYGEDGMHDKLLWEDAEEKVNEFKEKYIYPTIINKEIEEECMLWWIDKKLSRHSYDDADNNYESDDENGDGNDDNDKDLQDKKADPCEKDANNISSNISENVNKTAVSI